ncbi:hypothetical protein [Lentzea sp.]|uniref:hypothetical protein n=1 Tax=Lentzea sp. TaxID=56099 RepID=UPI002ED6359F
MPAKSSPWRRAASEPVRQASTTSRYRSREKTSETFTPSVQSHAGHKTLLTSRTLSVVMPTTPRSASEACSGQQLAGQVDTPAAARSVSRWPWP